MPYHPNIPLAGDTKAASQPLILDNFQFLNNVATGVNPFIVLPEQPAAPAQAANQISMYTKVIGGITSLFILPETGQVERDITTAVKASPGSTMLPSGIVLKWGTGTIHHHDQPIVYGGIGNFPTNTLWAMATSNEAPANTGNDAKDWILLADPATYAITGFNVHRNYYQGADVNFVWLAIGY